MRPTTLSVGVLVATVAATLATSTNARADEETATTTASRPREPPPPVATTTAPPPKEETLFGDHVDHGGYGAPELKVTSVADSGALLAGAHGGWIINHHLVLGGGGYGLTTDVPSPSVLQPANGGAKLTMAYGGLRFGAILAPHSIVHVAMSMLVGGGNAGSATSSGAAHRSDTFWVVEPDVALEANLARNVRLTAGFEYRIVGGTEVPGLTATNLSGPAGSLAVKFGVF
jgi:hypothetical protein